jgi:hypothetical protein
VDKETLYHSFIRLVTTLQLLRIPSVTGATKGMATDFFVTHQLSEWMAGKKGILKGHFEQPNLSVVKMEHETIENSENSLEMERLISASEFDKLNSFSTTLIRVLSQLYVSPPSPRDPDRFIPAIKSIETCAKLSKYRTLFSCSLFSLDIC